MYSYPQLRDRCSVSNSLRFRKKLDLTSIHRRLVHEAGQGCSKQCFVVCTAFLLHTTHNMKLLALGQYCGGDNHYRIYDVIGNSVMFKLNFEIPSHQERPYSGANAP